MELFQHLTNQFTNERIPTRNKVRVSGNSPPHSQIISCNITNVKIGTIKLQGEPVISNDEYFEVYDSDTPIDFIHSSFISTST